jgi:oxygen-independent coproporphyrinogen-3 oxidase
MAGPQIEGLAVPVDGSLPADALMNLQDRPLSFYVHVPYCSSRCGYCDFNTYTAEELGEGVTRASWRGTALAEVDLAKAVLGQNAPKVSTIFVGGGTPTLLPAQDLVDVVQRIQDLFGLQPDCEITTEANPDSVTFEQLVELRKGGFTRISFGMQSASSHVLNVLNRTHTPGKSLDAVAMARQAGFEHINLDLIYGTPGESLLDLQQTLDAVATAEVDHVSAYALIVEDGTRLAADVKRGVIAHPDDDDMADKYELIEKNLSALNMNWYEVSNWSRTGGECRHNVHYWRSDNWWGIGPGAHSHINGVRWWNVKHPTAWTGKLSLSQSPGYAREILTAEDRYVEDVLLRMRLSEGMPVVELKNSAAVQRLLADELIEYVPTNLSAQSNSHVALTQRGRLLADLVIHQLLD